MAGDPFGRGGTTTGGAKDPFGRTGAAPSKGGGGNILGHLVSDVKDTLANIPGGVIHTVGHPIGTAKAIGKSYAQTYGPLFQGKFGKFFHGVEQHPLGPILDAATVLTLGAGGAARAGELLGKAGVISDTSKLANLGKATDLTVPDFAKAAGQSGEDIVLKQSSRNPLIRARQVRVNKTLNKLPVGTPIVGSGSRVVKALSREPERAGARLTIAGQPFKQAFDKLSSNERAAWHMLARGVHPLDYAKHLEAQDGHVSTATLNILNDPKVAALVDKPSANLRDALSKGREVSDYLGKLKVQAGHISEQSAAESPYRLARLVSGAKHEMQYEPIPPAELKVGQMVTPADRKNLGRVALIDDAKKTATVHFFNHATRLEETKDFGVGDLLRETGYKLVGGRDIEAIANELHARGHEQPFYVPDSAETGKGAGAFTRKPTGLAEPGKSGASKQNLGVLANRGLLAIHENPLTREFNKFRSHTEASLLHDELVKHAAALPKGVPLPADYEYLKLNRGESAAPYTERIGGEFEHALAPGTADKTLTRDEAHPDLATNAQGERLVIPSSVRKILENKTLTYHGTLHHLLYNQPTSVWKHLVLGLRPAFFGNITVGNSILGALQMAPGRHGLAGWLNQVVPGADKVLGSKLSKSVYDKVFPEQAAGSFGHSTGFTSNKGLNVAQKAYQGVMPATIAYENVLRRAMAEGWAKAIPEVRTAMKRNGGDVNKALLDVAKSDPAIVNEISKRIDDALGNYRSYNQFERKLKQLIPFYGWDRHIVRSIARLISERPATVNALTKEGAEGKQLQDKALGELPSYMQGDLKLGDLPNGRTSVLSTRSLNPFNTLADLAGIPGALTGKAGGSGSETLTSGLNPLVQALLEQATGRSLLSGAPIKGNAFLNTAENIPQASLLASLFGHGKKTKPTALYQNDTETKLANLLGFPLKKPLLQTAHLYAKQSGK